MRVELDPHALARIAIRGATAQEAERAVREGMATTARHGRTRFVREFPEPVLRAGRIHSGRDLTVFAAPIKDGWRIITVIVKFRG